MPLELAFRQLKEKLSGLGYFEPTARNRCRAYPRRIALVTSPTGAAVRDMLEILGRRWPAAEDLGLPGPRCRATARPEEIAAAMRPAQPTARHRESSSSAAAAAAWKTCGRSTRSASPRPSSRSRIPVVSGVGHEIDVTIADLVADLRALTPSEAAERWCPTRTSAGGWPADGSAAAGAAGSPARPGASPPRRPGAPAAFRLPLERVREQERRLDELERTARRAVGSSLERLRAALEAQAGRLEALSPLNVLARGYSLTRTESDRHRRCGRPDRCEPGDRLITQVQHGRVVSRVEGAARGIATRVSSAR